MSACMPTYICIVSMCVSCICNIPTRVTLLPTYLPTNLHTYLPTNLPPNLRS